ncbi:unnamed protein product [Prorocentrum cordatum]|uniref:Stalled ribosome sensor GCN1-like N-terminal domain-containing protein n=1 Tax=Prorocentrum cordatum TaxID=2364126 RepID=A0ABN9S081_9DINO|nr:unnamed protein product [Polarella glacialis]
MALSDEDLLSAIKVLAQDFPFKEASECREWTDELASRCAERCAEKDAEPLSPDVCKAILQFVFSVAAPQAAEHRPLQWSCLELVAAAGRATARQEGAGSRADLHGFLFRLAKKEAKSQPVWKPRMLILMLQWVTRWIQVSGFGKVLEGLGEDAFDRKVVTSFAEALYGELGASDRWRPRWSLKASRSLCRLLHLCPLFAEHAAGWVAKKPEEAPAVLVAALGAESVAYPESFTGRGALVEAYAKGVLESKGAASDGNLAAWASVVAVVTPEEFEKQLLPLALRMTKRNPAATAASVPSMASHLRLDLSGQSRELLDPYGLELLKDKEKRPRGLRLVRSVAQGSRDACALLAVVEAWMESLKKAGKVDDKQAILLATATLADGLAPGACAGDAAEVVRRVLDAKGALVKCAGEDANEETRGLGYRAVGSLASQLPAAEREAAVKVLLKPLSDKKATDPVKLAAVSALVGIAQLAGEAPMPGSGAVLEGALPLVTVGATKPAQRFQSLLAWAACVRCSADDLAKALKKDHLVVLKDGSSFVNSVATILKAPAPELHAQAQLWGALLAGRVAGLLDPAAAAQGLAEKGSVLCIPPAPFAEALPTARSAVVLLACLHERGRGDGGQGAGAGRPSRPAESPAARAGLLEAAAGAGGFEPLLLLLAQALLAWLAELSQTPAKQRQVSNASLRDTLLDLCRAASRSSVAPRPETLALLALAAHHPMLSSRAWPAPKLWGHLCSAGPLAERVEQAPAALWQAVRTLVGAARALPAADSTGFRRAACALAGALDPGRAPAEGAKETGCTRR